MDGRFLYICNLLLFVECKIHIILLYELVLFLTTKLQENSRDCQFTLFHGSFPYFTMESMEYLKINCFYVGKWEKTHSDSFLH